jgi:hypothetical protein
MINTEISRISEVNFIVADRSRFPKHVRVDIMFGVTHNWHHYSLLRHRTHTDPSYRTREAVSWLRRLVIDPSPPRPAFVPRSINVRFVVDKISMGQDFFRVLPFYPVNSIPPWLSILIYRLGDEQYALWWPQFCNLTRVTWTYRTCCNCRIFRTSQCSMAMVGIWPRLSANSSEQTSSVG